MEIFLVVILFILGLSIGSFVNVVIYRTLHEESFVKGRSRCDHCRKQIAWYDNIPLLSFAVLTGKCRYCRKLISIQHPIVELLTGVLFVWWYLVGKTFFLISSQPLQTVQSGYWLLVGVLLLIVLVSDVKAYIIPDFTVVGLVGLALLYRWLLVSAGVMMVGDFWGALLSGIGIAGFFALLIVITRGRGMGWGDVKLALALGLLLGWPRAVIAVFLAFVLGAITGICLIILKKKTMGQILPFGPFLVAGTVLALIYGYRIWDWYLALMQ